MRPRFAVLNAAASLLILFVAVSRAHAHDPSLSGIRILFRKADVVVNVTTHISRLIRAEGDGKAALSPVEMDQAVRRRLRVLIDAKAFVPRKANVIGDNANDLLTWQAISPKPGGDCDVTSRLYPEDPASRTVVSVLRDGVSIREALLEETHGESLAGRPKPAALSVAAQYLREGVVHILSGPDHIAFALGLLLLGGTLKSLLRTVTSFTIAHSITLSLAATGVWNPSPRIVEPLIALSIVAIAVENLRPRKTEDTEGKAPRDYRPYYAFGFGLIHGFGFAGALSEVGLPHDALVAALAAFNIGVEIGQAAIVLSIAPLIALLAMTRPVVLKRLVVAGSLVIGVAGAYWFSTRLLNLRNLL